MMIQLETTSAQARVHLDTIGRLCGAVIKAIQGN